MALSTSYFTGRITAEQFPMLGTPSEQLQLDLLTRAVRMYVGKMDDPNISANLSVTSDTGTGPYDIPATIRRLTAIYNAEDVPKQVSYSYDLVKRQITFKDRSAPNADETWTCYGTPKEVITNLDAIIAAISEDYEHVIWAYIDYNVAAWSKEANRVELLKEANELAFMERKARNKLIDAYGIPNQYKDVQGRRIGDAANAEGFDTDISNDYGMDL